ncbi:DinB family protein [Oscillatoria amoena NRMC-F 0135]|nr:DinB family protein [Oscillatoria amoena NRMC-F 0135]
MIQEVPWFERDLVFGRPKEMLPYFLERLEGTLARLKAKLKGIPGSHLIQQRNGKWSVHQNIGHLAEVDEVACKRIDEMIAGVEVMSPAVFEPRQDYNAMSTETVLSVFRKARMENLNKYRALSEPDLTRFSIHPRLRVKMTPVDLAWFDAEHDDHHLVKISQIIYTLKK